jgi:hypothetical protein
MFADLTKMLSSKKAPSRRGSFKPQFEALEARDTPSAGSSAIHAVTDIHGNPAVFYLNEQDGRLLPITAPAT